VKLTKEESNALIEEFTEKEVREAIFRMKHNEAPRPDGFQLNSIRYFGV